MIIVAGWARTGTSIMFRCLQESGFYGGEQRHLTGLPYKTEHNMYRVCNFLIMYYLGFQSISAKQYKKQTLVDDLFVDKPEEEKSLPHGVRRKMQQFLQLIESDGVNILKDPQSAFAMKEWLKFDEKFAHAKYIWCRRDPLEAAKSFVRLKIPRIPQYRGVLTTKKAMKTYALHDKIWEETLHDLSHIQVDLEQLIMETETTAERISEFIGVPFDTSLVTEKATYRGGNRFNLKVERLNMEELQPVEFN